MDASSFTFFQNILSDPKHFISILFSLSLYLCLILVLQFTLRFILDSLIKKQSLRARHPWYHKFFKALKTPLYTLIWVLYLSLALDKLLIFFDYDKAADAWLIGKIHEFALIIFFLWLFFSYIYRMEGVYKRLARTGQQNLALINALAQISRLIVGLIGFLIILHTLGISVMSLAAIGGIGAAGVAFAAKGILGNFFGGLLLYINRPFMVGEKIKSPDRSIEGVVEEIGWMLTCVRDSDQRPIYIPNGLFTDIILINISRMTHLRVITDIGLRYEDIDKVEIITQDIKAMLSKHPRVDQNQAILVNFNKCLDSSLNINLICCTNSTLVPEFMEIQQAILIEVMRIIQAHGAECAFPSRTVYMQK